MPYLNIIRKNKKDWLASCNNKYNNYNVKDIINIKSLNLDL